MPLTGAFDEEDTAIIIEVPLIGSSGGMASPQWRPTPMPWRPGLKKAMREEILAEKDLNDEG